MLDDSACSSPEKQDMSSEFDYLYDGDSKMVKQRGSSSKLKSRRRNKKHRKDKQRKSPSPSKFGSKQHYGDFDSSSEKE